MEIQIHSWREFLKEYAIIVLGIATALAAATGVLAKAGPGTEAR